MTVLAQRPWRRWFRSLLARQAARAAALELLDEGPDGDWRPPPDPPALREQASGR